MNVEFAGLLLGTPPNKTPDGVPAFRYSGPVVPSYVTTKWYVTPVVTVPVLSNAVAPVPWKKLIRNVLPVCRPNISNDAEAFVPAQFVCIRPSPLPHVFIFT